MLELWECCDDKLPVADVITTWIPCQKQLAQKLVATKSLNARRSPNKVHCEVQLVQRLATCGRDRGVFFCGKENMFLCPLQNEER